MGYLEFIKSFIKDPKIGALTGSSPYVARRIAREIRPGYKFIVEYGAGDGIITKGILNALPPDGKLLAIETNGEFVSELKKIHDKRLIVLRGDAVHFAKGLGQFGFSRIDAVISGIPFSFLSPKVREGLVRETHATLAPGGMFLVYQYSFLILPILKKSFRNVRLLFEPRNFLPYFIMVAKK